MANTNSGIYTITNTVNGKQYVGSAVNFQKRWTRHSWELKNNRHHNSYLQRAYDKYGDEAFQFDIVETVEDLDILRDVEQTYLDKGEYPYNMLKNAAGGSMKLDDHPRGEEIRRARSGPNHPLWGKPHSEERRRKHSEAMSGEKHPFWGKKRPPEVGERIGNAKRGILLTEEHKRKIGIANKGRIVSEETRTKLSAALTGRKLSEDHIRQLSENRMGENNPYFKGWYLTPFGKFASPFTVTDPAGNRFPSTSISRICHHPEKVISASSYRQSTYLQHNHDRSVIGRRYADLGFGYEPKSSE